MELNLPTDKNNHQRLIDYMKRRKLNHHLSVMVDEKEYKIDGHSSVNCIRQANLRFNGDWKFINYWRTTCNLSDYPNTMTI